MDSLLKKIILILLLICSCRSQQNITVYLIGDSTMSDKPNPEHNPERGWGQMLPLFFDESVAIKNFAMNGRSTKSFINEGRWDSVKSEMKPGDYVFIQFGHNDQKFKDSTRFTNPFTGYRQNLIKFVRDTKNKGGIPLLFSSIVRRNFNEFGVLEDTHGLYPFVMRQVAQDLNVTFIDMQLKSENLVVSLGQEKSKEIYLWVEQGKYEMFPEGRQDNTHFCEKGATEMARLAVEGLKENNLTITKFLRTQ